MRDERFVRTWKVCQRAFYRVANAAEKFVRDVFVKEIAHRVDEDHAR